MHLWQMPMTNLMSTKTKGPVSSNPLVSPAPSKMLREQSSLWPNELARRSTLNEQIHVTHIKLQRLIIN